MDAPEQRFCVYVIRNQVDGKGYVGKTFDPESRWYRHKRLAATGADTYLYRAMRKHGADSFTFAVVESCGANEALAFEREQYWVKALFTRAPVGYNMSDGGEGQTGFKHSEESKPKMASRPQLGKPPSEAHRASIAAGLRRYFAQYGCAHKGVPKSEETKRKLSEKGKGRIRNVGSKRTPEQCANISSGHARAKLARRHPEAFSLEHDEQ